MTPIIIQAFNHIPNCAYDYRQKKYVIIEYKKEYAFDELTAVKVNGWFSNQKRDGVLYPLMADLYNNLSDSEQHLITVQEIN